MAFDFTQPHHLPNRRPPGDHADPFELPRQRRGTTPQQHGRYPDYDVLAEQDHWDEQTRKVVLERVEPRPPFRFFDAREVETLKRLCDVALHQYEKPRIPVLSFVDEKLASGERDGYQYEDLPDDGQTWKVVALGLDESARNEWRAESFAAAARTTQEEIVATFAEGKLRGDTWSLVNVKRAFSVVMRYSLQAFYAHPWAWNEIGFGGPAYPRGYAVFGSSHLGDTEPWEGREAVHTDPVRETQSR